MLIATTSITGSDWFLLTVGVILGAIASILLSSVFQTASDRFVFRARAKLASRDTARRTVDGIWRSRYVYSSSEVPDTDLVDEHLLVLKTHRGGIRAASLESEKGSNLTVELDIEGSVATGSWRELTPQRQRAYHGACQLVLNHTGDELTGVWTGFSRTGTVGTGEWTMRRLSDSTSRKSRRKLEKSEELAWRKRL